MAKKDPFTDEKAKAARDKRNRARLESMGQLLVPGTYGEKKMAKKSTKKKPPNRAPKKTAKKAAKKAPKKTAKKAAKKTAKKAPKKTAKKAPKKTAKKAAKKLAKMLPTLKGSKFLVEKDVVSIPEMDSYATKHGGVYVQRQYVRCGKKDKAGKLTCQCSKRGGKMHGPYWYAYTGRTDVGLGTPKYIGKVLDKAKLRAWFKTTKKYKDHMKFQRKRSGR